MINVVSHLKVFDTVMQYAFAIQKPKGNGSIILQDDWEKLEKARVYALDLNRRGILYELYQRIMKGTV